MKFVFPAVLLVIGYVVGAKWPGLASKAGL